MVKRVNSILVFLFLFAPLYAQSGWVLRKEKDGIFVYDLKTDSARFNSIKVETELTGAVEDLLYILMDVGNHYQWAYGTKSAALLRRVSDREIIFYKELKSPAFMVSNRDIVIQLKVNEKSGTKAVTVESKALPDFIPPKADLVRVPLSNERWIITPMAEQKLKVHYYLQFDPGGVLPPLLVNLFISKGPFETFTGLKEMLKNRTQGR